jgi:hypothetical protein
MKNEHKTESYFYPQEGRSWYPSDKRLVRPHDSYAYVVDEKEASSMFNWNQILDIQSTSSRYTDCAVSNSI